MVNLSSLLTAMVALSVATERVTEFVKNLPGFGSWFSEPKIGKANADKDKKWKERLRVISVHLLAFVAAVALCKLFPQAIQSLLGSNSGNPSWRDCALYGLLASGGSGFWNSALDTFRNVKKTLGKTASSS